MTDVDRGPSVVPPGLRPGDRVVVVSPSGPLAEQRLQDGLSCLRAWGFDAVPAAHAGARLGHLAGADADRLADLQAALDDHDVRGVWASRGGYGLTRIVHRLDWSATRERPKVIVGFSDTTALLHAAWSRARLRTVHGQFAGRAHLVASHEAAAARLRELVAGRIPDPLLQGLDALTDGRATGPLLGGNLAVLCAQIGTPEAIDLRGAVLFVEDVNEPPYGVDRLLTQLRRSGALDEVRGVVVGEFSGDAPGVDVAATADVVADRLGDLGVPVVVDAPIGHRDDMLALPHGATVALDAGRGVVRVVDGAG